jgi:hypothetical protein
MIGVRVEDFNPVIDETARAKIPARVKSEKPNNSTSPGDFARFSDKKLWGSI